MYKRIPTQIAIAAFTKEETADEVVKKLVDAMADGKAVCTNLAIAKKNKDGKIKVKELGKPSLLKGMAAGTAAGAVVGSVVGGISLAFLGPVAVVGGAVGGIAGGAVGSINGAAIGTYAAMTVEGMDKSKLKTLGSSLEPGTSAIVAIFGEVVVKKSKHKAMLKEVKEGTDEIVKKMGEDISKNLKDGNDIAYVLAVDEDGIMATKMVKGEDAMNFKAFILTNDEAAEISFRATKEGTAVRAAVVTEEGAAIQAAYATADGVVAGRAVMTDKAVVYEVAAETSELGIHEIGVIMPGQEQVESH